MSWERVLLPDIEAAQELAGVLRALDVSVRLADVRAHSDGDPPSAPEFILIGGSVSAGFAVRVLSVAIDHWPSLRFVFLTSDQPAYEPEEQHYEVFIGAPLDQSIRNKCLAWSMDDWNRLDPEMLQPEFHSFIRNFYSASASPHTQVEFAGGPRDGDRTYICGTSTSAPRLFFVTGRNGVVSRYELDATGGVVRYRFIDSVVED